MKSVDNMYHHINSYIYAGPYHLARCQTVPHHIEGTYHLRRISSCRTLAKQIVLCPSFRSPIGVGVGNYYMPLTCRPIPNIIKKFCLFVRSHFRGRYSD